MDASDNWTDSDTDIGEEWIPDSQDPYDFQWTDAEEFLEDLPARDDFWSDDTVESDDDDPRGEEAQRDAIEACSRMINNPQNRSLDVIVNEMREKCQEIEINECDLRRMGRRFTRFFSEYRRITRIRGDFPAYHVIRGKELAYIFETFSTEGPDPTTYPIGRHMVNYIGERGVDGGGLRMEFFSEVCNQLRGLFDYIHLEVDDPRMYISSIPDEEILDKINRHGGKFKEDGSMVPFTTEDLPKLYRLAGGMCQHAAISSYSTGFALSRALLTAMVSHDTGVSELQLATIYLIEAYKTGKNELSNVSIISESFGETFLETITERSRDVYLLDNPDKRRYIADFINGFKISQLLSEHSFSANELFEIIGGRPFFKSEYEAWWRSESNVEFSDPELREKFLDLHLNHDQELVEYMRRTKTEMRDMTEDQILEIYHHNTLRSIAATPIISKRLKISVQSSNVVGLFPHTCNKILDVNREWLLGTTFSGGDFPWISQADASFMASGYTNI